MPSTHQSPAETHAILVTALTHHQNGRLEEAEKLYRTVLEKIPTHPDALNLLGVIETGKKNFDEAIHLIRQAIFVDDKNALFHNNLGLALKEQGNNEEAIEHFSRAIKLKPDLPEAHYNLGIIFERNNDNDEAISHYKMAVAHRPNFSEACCNLAGIFVKQGRINDAKKYYERSLASNEDSATTHNNLGILLAAEEKFDDAVAHYLRAIAINPHMVEAYNNLGLLFMRIGRSEDALNCYERAIEINPYYKEAENGLQGALYQYSIDGKKAEAIIRAEKWVALNPDSQTAKHILSALNANDDTMPYRAADDYVTTVFDNFAEDFDSVLSKLEYRAPELVANALKGKLNPKSLDIIDIGCGTGWSGVYLEPYANTLVGVDLSGKMLAKAKKRNIYNELHKTEITEFLQNHKNTYDLIAAADVLNYFGDLNDVFAASFLALRPYGHIVFTVEQLLDEETSKGRKLQSSGRYAHNEKYIRERLAFFSFEILEINQENLRVENGRNVPGLIVLAKKSK